MLKDIIDLAVCQCCILAIANGDVCDCPKGHADDVTRGMARETAKGAYIVAGGSDDEETWGDLGFSWSACDVCRSRLAGDRHRASLHVHDDDEDAPAHV